MHQGDSTAQNLDKVAFRFQVLRLRRTVIGGTDSIGRTAHGRCTKGTQRPKIWKKSPSAFRYCASVELSSEALIALEEGGTEGAPRGLNGPIFGKSHLPLSDTAPPSVWIMDGHFNISAHYYLC